MTYDRQFTCDGQVHCTLIKAYVSVGYAQRREGGWKTTRTSGTFQWDSDYEGRPAGSGQEKQQASGQSSQQRIVLHVDDDEEDRMLLEETLKKLDRNITVWHADNGKEALSLLKRSKELCDLPCLIVLDINMPGMNGKEVLKEIKKDKDLALLPLILFTTASETTHTDFIKKENVQFITKPLTPAELIDSARKMLKHCAPDSK